MLEPNSAIRASSHSKALWVGAARRAGVPQSSSHLQQHHCNCSEGKGAVHTQQFQLLVTKRLKEEFFTVITHF